LNLSDTTFTCGIYIHGTQMLLLFIQITATLGINDGVNETLGITVELEITVHMHNLFLSCQHHFRDEIKIQLNHNDLRALHSLPTVSISYKGPMHYTTEL
jgi:hypothetical protein